MDIKTDGNGSVIIPKKWIAIITLLIILASSFASVIAFSTEVKKDITFNIQKIEAIDLQIHEMEKQVADNNVFVNKIQTDIDNIKSDITEIKADIKQILKSLGGNPT